MEHQDPVAIGGSGALNRVKNKAPAPVQITAEQLLREAYENREELGSAVKRPRQTIADAAELADYQQTTRKRFEDRIIRARSNLFLWIRYAKWEEAQRDFVRARSVFERALDIDYRTPLIWLAYAEFEMRNKFINHARNICDRAVSILPRVDQLWLKYAFMEEMLDNYDLARLVFRRWLQWKPDISAYVAFVQFELRHANIPGARMAFQQMVAAHPTLQAYLKFAAFEEAHRNIPAAREVYERAADLKDISNDPQLYTSFAKFEERAAEPERARAIYKYALSNIADDSTSPIYEAFTAFEKQRGERDSVEAAILAKKRSSYEKKLEESPRDYDLWFDLIRLEEANICTPNDAERVRKTYERAVANTPPPTEKRFWRRYIYLWISYAIWEELEQNDLDRAGLVYESCLAAIPNGHRQFSFGKIWLMAAKLQIRRGDLRAARRILGNGIGVLPQKDSLYREYIALELSLGEIDRARILFKQWLMRNPSASVAYIEFADMEAGLGELERARAIYEIALAAEELDAPEAVWKTYIDFEIAGCETERVTQLYERLIGQANDVRLWISYGKFMQSVGDNEARSIYDRGSRALKEKMVEQGKDNESARADRVKLLDAWLAWEQVAVKAEHGSAANVNTVQALMPKRIKRRRLSKDGDGGRSGWVEFYEYVFPEEQASKPELKLLMAARKWAHERNQVEQS